MATPPNINAYNKRLGLRVKSKRLQLHDLDFTLPRSVLFEKDFTKLVLLEKALSGMEHINAELHLKGNLIIVYVECSWAAHKIFGNNSGITYVLGCIIEKKFLIDLTGQLDYIQNSQPGNSLNLRSLIMLNYKVSIEILSRMLYTGMYAIPKSGKSIFINTMLNLYGKYKNDKPNVSGITREFSESLPMLKIPSNRTIITAEEINFGKFACYMPIPAKHDISLYKKQVSLWDKGLSWDVKLLAKVNEMI